MGFISYDPSPRDYALFITFAVLNSFLFLVSLKYCCSRPHYTESKVLSILFPISITFMIYENIVLAAGTRINDSSFLSDLMLTTHPCVVPILLLVTFEITYLVHKRRSVKFCGIQFDEGRRIKTTMRSWVMRNLVNLVSISLITVGVIVDFDMLALDKVDDAAGRVGWIDLFKFEGNWEEQTHKVLALLPTGILVLANFYFAIMMWRYGTLSSMIIHSSYCNPWISQFIGTLALAGGQAFTKEWFSAMSNLGESVMVFMTLSLMHLVDKDMIEALKFDDFLDIIGDKTQTKAEVEVMKGYCQRGQTATPNTSSRQDIGSEQGISSEQDVGNNTSRGGGVSFGSGVSVPIGSVESSTEDGGGFGAGIWKSLFPPSPQAARDESADGGEMVWGAGNDKGAIVELQDVAVRL